MDREEQRKKRTYKDQKWTAEMKQFLLDHKAEVRNEVYRLFCEKFGNIVSLNAINAERSRLGAVQKHIQHGTTKLRPLYSEQLKKGYVRIKVALPAVWMSKAKWVWLETHPGECNDVCPTDSFYFLDGDNRNFAPDNILKVRRCEQTVFIQCGGIVKGNPEQSRINYLNAKLKLAQLDLLEKAGLVIVAGNSRFEAKVFREQSRIKALERYHRDIELSREKARIYHHKKWSAMTEEQKDIVRAKSAERRKKRMERKTNAESGN